MRGKVLIALAVVFCLAGSVFSAERPGPPTFRLVPQDYTTIQAAIDAAVDNDVVMLSSGVYSGVGNRDLNFGGKAITVRSAGDPAACIIDCEGLGRGFIFQSGEGPDSAIEGLTIMGGYHDSYGGGIECELSSPTIFNCIIMDCSAYDGGGIDCYGASPLIRDCIISGNSAENDGGGIEFYESFGGGGLQPEVINCLIESNSAGNNGGAISSYLSAPQILNCTLVDNYSTYNSGGFSPGGIYATGNSFVVRNCILWDRDGAAEITGCSAEYSCVKGGESGINGNTADDPLFRTGPLGDYYLSQIDAGQLVNSPSFDAGDPLWTLVDLGLEGYATATDNVADVGSADMGYHYPSGGAVVYYELDASVVGTGPNGQLQVTPNEVLHREFSEVRLTAVPDFAYKVSQWTGTDDDSSVSNDNVVLMTLDRTVTVEFVARQPYQLTTMVVGGNGTITPPSGMYLDGELVPIFAEPVPGFRVREWTGTVDDFSIDPNNYVLMDSDKTVTVEFIDMSKSVYLTARVVDGRGGTIVPWRGVYELSEGVPPTTVLLQAIPDTGFKVKEWIGTNNDFSKSTANVVTMTEDKFVTVEFEGSRQVFLTVEVDQPEGAPPEYGWVEENNGNRINGGIWVYENEVVRLTAVSSNPGLYDVREWFNVDKPTDLTAPVQTVTMSEGGKYVRVQLKKKSQSPAGPVWIVGSMAHYDTIQDALDAALGGNVVRVADGIYSGTGNYNLNFGGKGITLESEYGPEYCIIDPQFQGRGISFQGGETGQTLVDGFTIRNGSAPFGGGISCLVSGPRINNCIITNCSATSGDGGGILIASTNEIDPDVEWDRWDLNTISWPKISNCKIINNTAADDGGGIACVGATPMIMSTEISSNTANGVGGGISCDDASNAEIINCLISENVSRLIGAGIHFQNSFGMVHLSTIVNNNSLANNDRGGITVRLQNQGRNGREVVITNSIIWGNGDDLWQNTTNLIDVTYSCIEDDNGIGNNKTGVIGQDPRFVTGPLSSSPFGYYLPFDSPCVDAGEEPLVFQDFRIDYQLSSSITTDVGNATDFSDINMGFHYPKFFGIIKPVLRTLRIFVNNDFGSVGFGLNGSTGPHYGQATFQNSAEYYFVDGTVVDLQAIPIPGYRVMSWQGADDDSQGFNQLGVFNTVTLQGGDRWVWVTFEPKFTTIWHVPGDFPYTGIQDAIDAAKDGDTIMIHPATYIGTGFVVEGKDITITSENPTDPDIVAATIIDCTNQLNRAFVIMGTGYGSCTLNGFTIINAVWGGGQYSTPGNNAPDGWDGADAFFTWTGGGIESYGDHIIANCVLRGCRLIGHGGGDGKNGGGGNDALDARDGGHGGAGSDAAGGGIYIGWGSAQILNCTIEGCEVTGGLGGDGANGAGGNPSRWISQGGYGGFAGKAYGGGIYVGGNGVIIEDCTIRDCRVIGARGGDGGDGGALSSGGNGGVPGAAFGAGIYIADWASADVKGTVVENCEVIGGLGGNGGDRAGTVDWSYGGGTSVAFPSWEWAYRPPQGDPIQYTGKGGGVYCGIATNVSFTDCRVTGNTVRGSVTGIGEIVGNIVRQEPTKNYQLPGYGAGIYCGDHTQADFSNCYVKNNMIVDNPTPAGEPVDTLFAYFINDYIGYGGGICLDGLHVANIGATVKSSQFAGNYSSVGGGIFASGSDIDIQDCNFIDQISNLGGGMFVIDSLSHISRCVITGNAASSEAMAIDTGDPDSQGGGLISGAGGGIYSFTTNANIVDCQISGNIAGDTGGGVYLGGHPESIFYYNGMLATPTVRNCLITGNSAGQHGGGVVFDWYAEGEILNSTIADNAVGILDGYGGGLYVGSEGHASVSDSIIWGNAGINGSQIALGSSDNVSAMPSALDIVYSAIQDLEEADDIEVVFAVDTTDGMVGTITEIQNSILQIIYRIASVAENYRVGIVGYRDPLGFSEYLYHDYSGLTDDTQQLLTAVNFMITGGGSDFAAINPGSEAVYSGLMHCIDAASHNALLAANGAGNFIDLFSPGMDWSESRDVRKIIILIGDIGPRQPEENTGYMLGDVVAAANAKGITIWSIMTGNNFYRTPVTDQYFANLATATGGAFFEEPLDSMVVSAVMNAIGISGQIYNPLYVQPGSELSGLDPNTGVWAESTHNIYTDPQFVLDYYLSQVDSGQLVDSNCVNAGSIDADELAAYIGHDVTTRTNHVPDAGTIAADGSAGRVDIGYHYDASLSVEEYMLTIVSPGVGGSIVGSWMGEDHGPGTYWLPQATQVRLYAVPDMVDPNTSGYIIGKWTGTDDDTSLERTIIITMDADKVITVEFVLDLPRNLLVPLIYPTIEEAVAASRNGDSIVLSSGVHYITDPDGIDFGGKAITLRSTNPDNVWTVANTIIDCQGSRYLSKRAFHFQSGEGPDSRVFGVTITNGFMAGAVGASFSIPGEPWPPNQTPDPAPPRANSGRDATGDGYGGAIFCENGSSPTIENCVITNCKATGGQGGDGANGYSIGNQNRDGQSGGHAGSGIGIGHGGAIACIEASSPLILNCTISDNSAEGGTGGDAGNGSTRGNNSNGRESWGGDGGDASGEGKGGGIYAAGGCKPVIIECTMSNNQARPGSPGEGGVTGPGGNWPNPWNNATDGRDGFFTPIDISLGGAIYCDDNADMYIAGSTFSGNRAFDVFFYQQTIITEDGFETETVEFPTYTKGGALYGSWNNALEIRDSEFSENMAGAIYLASDCDLDMIDCLVRENKTRDDAISYDFFYYYYYTYQIPMEPADTPSGGLYVGPNSAVDVNDCTFASNYTHANGGAVTCKTDATFQRCAFADNTAYGTGGAIDIQYEDDLPVYGPGGVIDDQYEDDLTVALTATFVECSFAQNQAKLGGAMRIRGATGRFIDSYFAENRASHGGGIYVDAGTVSINGGVIFGNTALDRAGVGGGISLIDSSAFINNCILQDNQADGEEGYGGAIGLNGGNPTTLHRIENCLVAGNFAGGGGGGIANLLSASPLIANCTFDDNSSGGSGGGVFDGWSSRSKIIDSIFNDCSTSAIYAERVGFGTTVEYCLFNENSDGDLYDEFTAVSYDGGSQIDSLPGNRGNRDGDPMFIMGGPDGESADPNVVFGLYYHYYLDQTGPAVDSGSDTAENLGLDKYITDINGAFDTGIADMGFHHLSAEGVVKYQLTAVSQRDHGIIEPSSGMYYPGTMVRLTAVPDPGYRVVRWYGIDPDDSEKIDYAATFNYGLRSLKNGVLMSTDKNIIVEFDQPRTLVVGNVGGEDQYYTSIQHAIDDAQDGDVVMVLPGTYQSTTGRGPLWNITFYGKSIRLSSVNPDDSDTVASTVLDQFYINIDNVGPDAVIEGFTITRSRTRLFNSDLTIRNCVFTGNNWSGGNGRDGPGCGGNNPPRDGYDGVDLYGGAIQMYDSSPQILNCVFNDNSATGGDGGDGSNGCNPEHNPGWDGGWAGRAYGGAVYCGFTSNPVFKDCVFTNNYARGGDGGHGGNGVGPGSWPGGRGGSWEWAPSYEEDPLYWWWWDGWDFGDKYYEGFTWSNRYDWDLWSQWFHWDKYVSWDDFLLDWTFNPFLGSDGGFDPYDSRYDYWEYSGYGGAVYAEYGSSLQFSGCTFENNASYGGVSGIGGTGPQYSSRLPERKFNIETAGGAIYVADGSTVNLVNCVINDNLADTSTDIPTPVQNEPNPIGVGPDDYYVSFGGGIFAEDGSAIKLTDCIVSSNTACLGGGIYSSFTDTTITGTDVTDNIAFHGAGLHTIYANGTITDSVFTGNQANYTAAFRSDGSSDPADGIYGQGGGYYCFSSVVDIIDSVFRDNQATASGGGIYYGGSDQDLDFVPLLENSLITNNSANRDGGGISVNWFAEPTISNCTIADNVVTGSYGESTGFGGGLSVAYSTQTTIVNSIIWNNTSDNGAQISVGTGDIYGPMSSILNITHSDIGPPYDPNALEFDLGDVLAETTGQSVSGPKLVDAQDIYDQFNSGQTTVRVIVSLTDPVVSGQATEWDVSESVGALRQAVAGSQNSVLSSLTASEFTVGYVYENQAAFSGDITIAGLNKLLADPAVASVEPVRAMELMLAQAIPLANAMAAREAFDGTGVAIAIVDSGIDYTHPRLGGGGFPNAKVIGGYDTAEDDGDPMPAGEPHGTACAGIAAGDLGTVEDYIGGVAYGAKLYALKISADDGAILSDATLAAWDWCLTHRNDDPENPILVMSNSWGTPNLPFDNSIDADAFSPAMTRAATNATSAGITILAASGNDYFAGQGISWPAAMSDVISVGAVYDTTDEVTDYSNTAEILDILAPADPMYTTDIVGAVGYDPGDYVPNFNGTSSACPFAAGVVASLQHAAMSKMGTYLSHKKIRDVLVATGDPVTDSKVDITKPRVNLGAALGGLSFGPPIYIEDGCVVNGKVYYDFDPNSFVWGPETFNIEMDPLFIGDYFLNQVAAGQLVDSPCIDIGNDFAANIGLGAYTTRTDSVVDVNTVDLGYHHMQFPVLQYHLNIMVTNVEGAPAIEYTLDPDDAEYNQYTVVKVHVTPPPGYGDDSLQQFQVRWSGTDDDMATGPENYVTMDVDKAIHVTYTPRYYLAYTFDPVAELPGFSPVLTPPSGYKDKDVTVELSVDVVPDPNLYQIVWTGTDDDTSTQAFNAVTMDSDRQVTVTFQLKETRYYAVVCGISDYAFAEDLRWSVNDAEQFYRKLRQSVNWNPQAVDNPDNIILLTNSEATKNGIQAAIMEMADRTDDDDVFVFYFAGHGTTGIDLEPTDERDALDEYLVTYGGQNISDDEMSLWLSSENLPTRDYLVILDTSFYGANSDLVLSPRGIGGVAPEMGDGFAEDLVRVPVETPDAEVGIVLSACSADQLAWENVTLRHGVFTKYLLESMEKDNGADLFEPAGWISTKEAYVYAKDNVNDWMGQNADKFEDLIGLQVGVQQTVQINDTGHDGPVDFFDLDEITLQQRTISVPADYPTIQSAVKGARPGDVIILSSGFYNGTGLIIDKEVTITGTNPDDADIVAATVIYVGQVGGSGITFATTAGSKTVLNGVTIAGDIGFVWVAANGANGSDLSPDGGDGSPAEGGGIYCSYGSSPTISNCVIENFHIAGGNGGDGQDSGQDNLIAGRGGWGGWARGGGVYIAEYSSPTFINCKIRNCSATGGSGGNGGGAGGGGGGGGGNTAGFGGLWTNDTDATWQALGYASDYRFYSGYGGGVYCAEYSEPMFRACTISDNGTQGGMSGLGGDAGDGTFQQPNISYEIPSYGGGIYCSANSNVIFEGCSITGNVAAKPSETFHLSPSLGHGGGVAFENEASVRFSRYEMSTGGIMECLIGENTASVGGGIYFAGADAWIADCNVINNLAYQGAGIYGANLFDIYGKAKIRNCTIQDNFAGSIIIEAPDPADPATGDPEVVAGQGAGIYCDSVPAQIVDSTINDNMATASGGAIYITGAAPADPNVTNCLIVNNRAGRDGGGISVNWHSTSTISSCTISDNEAIGDFGPILSNGIGGGLYCGYFAKAKVIDNIFWNNAAALGRQIAVGTGFEFDPRPGVLTLSYSDIHGGLAEPAVYVEGDTTTMLPGSHEGFINADPLFETGPLGDYYLSQGAAGQSQTSLCVDAGSGSAARVLENYRLYTTRTDDAFDAYDGGVVDMGYHYRFVQTEDSCRFIDLVFDGIIRLGDFDVVAQHWMNDSCSADEWCDGTDFNADGGVDSDDLIAFGRCWLVEDDDAPSPDPSLWLIKPYNVPGSPTEITMTARTAYDAWGWPVAYYFERLVGPKGDPDNPSSGWLTGNATDPTTWTDSGLTTGSTYQYAFKVAEVRAYDGTTITVGNVTEYSDGALATAIDENDDGDVNPPLPNPSEWEQVPIAASASSIRMSAVPATDPEGNGVEYYFENETILDKGHDSGWQDESIYTDEGLDADTLYTYRVVTRDKSYSPEQGGYSDSMSATTDEGAEVDKLPPYPTGGFAGDPGDPDAIPPIPLVRPDPPLWQAFYKQVAGDTFLMMEAVPAEDDLSPPVQYRFVDTSGNHPSSEWQDDNTYFVRLTSWTEYGSFVIYYRDSALPNPIVSDPSIELETTILP